MAWECVEWAIEHTAVTGSVYAVLMVLAESAYAEDGVCRVTGERELARRMHVTDTKRLKGQLATLERLQLVRVDRSPGRRNRFTLTGYVASLESEGHVTPTLQQSEGHVTPTLQQSEGHVTPTLQQSEGHVTPTPGGIRPPHRGAYDPHATSTPVLTLERDTRTHAHVREATSPKPPPGGEFAAARAWAATPAGAEYIRRYRYNPARLSSVVSAYRAAHGEGAHVALSHG